MTHPINPSIIPMLEFLQYVSTYEEACLISKLLDWDTAYYTSWASVYLDKRHAFYLFDKTVQFATMGGHKRILYSRLRSYLQGLDHATSQ